MEIAQISGGQLPVIPRVAGNHAGGIVYSLKTFTENSRVWGLKDDVRRVLLYEMDVKTFSVVGAVPLHPAEAIILVLFDGTRTVADVESLVADLFSLGQQDACGNVAQVADRSKDALSETTLRPTPTHNYRPEQFIIPVHRVDCESRRLYRPINMLFRLSDDCMRDCIYCDVEKRKRSATRDLSRERWLELMDETVRLAVPSVTLSGGDPFVNRHVIEIIAALVQGGIHPLVATKSHITRSLATRIAGAGLKRMQVSIDAPTPGLGDLMTGSRGGFAAATASIRNLIAEGLTVRSNCVMTHINIRKAGELIDMLLAMGVDDISLTQAGRSPYIASDLNDSLFLDKADQDFLTALGEKYPKDVLRVSGSGDPGAVPRAERWRSFAKRSACSAGTWGFIVHCDGKVTLCDEMPTDEFNVVGDVTRQSLMDVWNSPRIQDVVTPPLEKFRGTACYNCAGFSPCHAEMGRCFRDAWKAHGSYYAPSPNCPLSPPGLRLA